MTFFDEGREAIITGETPFIIVESWFGITLEYSSCLLRVNHGLTDSIRYHSDGQTDAKFSTRKLFLLLLSFLWWIAIMAALYR